MKRINKVLSSPLFTTVMMIMAAVMLIFSGISGAMAALSYYSDDWQGEIALKDIGVALLENGSTVSSRTYKGAGVPDAGNLTSDESQNWDVVTGSLFSKVDPKDFKLGASYDEELKVQNTGTIDEYVRVNIYKYWMDADEKKNDDLDPSYIELDYKDCLGSDWIEDTKASTPGRTLLYYTKKLACDPSGNGKGEITSAFNKHIKINGDIARMVKQQISKDNKITTVYEYDGKKFCLDTVVEAVQDHHIEDASKSVWGQRVSVSGGTLSLAE